MEISTALNTAHRIGAENCEGEGSFQGMNPATQESLPGTFSNATQELVDETMEKARIAFVDYARTTPYERADFLDAIADEIEALGDPLVRRTMAESGLPEGRIKGERGRTCNQLRMFGRVLREGSWVDAVIDTAQPNREPMPKSDIRKVLEPVGPVVVFGASNFPLAFSTAGGDTASALAAGNPVIVKAHPSHPGCAALVTDAILKAAESCGMPDGVFSLLYDQGHTVGEALVMHPETQSVAFTGSPKGGRALFDLAGRRKHPIPVFAEMGSVNPVLMLPEAIANQGETLAKKYAGSITLGAGQFCTNPGLILTFRSEETETFIECLAEELAEMAPATMLNQGICENYDKARANVLDLGVVTTLAENRSRAGDTVGRPALARVRAVDFMANPALAEEVFGPFSLVVVCENEDEMAGALASLSGQLTGTVMHEGQDLANHVHLVDLLKSRVGRLVFNGVPTGVEVCAAMHHGGPSAATTDSRFTSVGTAAIKRFARPVCYQDCPEALLPAALQSSNPLEIWRQVDNEWTQAAL